MTQPQIRVLHHQGVSRRSVLAALGALPIAALAAGCGESTPQETGAATGSASSDIGEIRMFTWSGFDDPELVDPFEEATKARITGTTFASSDEMISKLKGGGTAQYDIVVPEQATIPLMAEQDLIEPFDAEELGNTSELVESFQQLGNWNPGGEFFGAPFVWGANAISYDLAQTEEEIDSLDALFDPKYKGRIAMRNESLDSLAIAAMRLGFEEPFNMDSKQLEEAKKMLIAQKPLVRAYWTDVAELQGMIGSGEVALGWSFLVVIEPLKQAGVDVKWVLPKEGAVGWNEGICMVKGAKNRAGAHAFANETLSEEFGLRLARHNGYSSTNAAALSALSEEEREGLGVDMEKLPTLRFKAFPPNKAEYDSVWNEVLSA